MIPRDDFLFQVGVMRRHPSKGPCACDPHYNRWCSFHADYDGTNPNSPAYMIGRHMVKCSVCGCNVVVRKGSEPICTGCELWAATFPIAFAVGGFAS